MFFVPWGWHVKTAAPIAWLEWPMMAVNPWRLSLLFVISGVVSRALLTKLNELGEFAKSRSWRLIIPLIAGMIFFVAPQPWVELRDRGVYSHGFVHFWLNDYAEFGNSRGTPLPTWNHLWFVAYLWVYSMILAAVSLLPQHRRAEIQHGFDRLFAGWRLYLVPIFWLFLNRTILLPIFGETHALADDLYGHLVYGFAFFFGVGLARSATTWQSISKNWKTLLVAAALSIVLTFAIKFSDTALAATDLARSGARAILAWTAILGLIGMALRYLHHDGPVRRYLTDAIFPYYIAHQTIIVVVGYQVKQLSADPWIEFVIILISTLAGCGLTYEIGRRINWLRPFLGLKSRPSFGVKAHVKAIPL
jgi:glucans biosynthesis protein C